MHPCKFEMLQNIQTVIKSRYFSAMQNKKISTEGCCHSDSDLNTCCSVKAVRRPLPKSSKRKEEFKSTKRK